MRQETLGTVGPADLACETIVTAISPGTETAAYTGAPPLRDGVGYPRLLGYCNVARVTAVGADVRLAKVGDRILSFMSHRSAFVIAEKDVLLRLPESVSSDDAVCAYLFHLGYNAVLRSDVRAGSRVCVVGLGALGLTTVAFAALSGAEVWGVSDHRQPGEIAGRFGAREIVSRVVLNERLEAGRQPLADIVVVTTNAWADWQLALRIAAQRGTSAVLGFPGRGEPAPAFNPLDSRFFYAKQLRIEAVGASPEKQDSRGFARFNQKDNIAFIVDCIDKKRLKPRDLVSARFPGHDLVTAYETLLARRNSPVTYLLDWS
jgi:threonine dehydrogenase-like Zn-dependent dehydrogenase